MVPILNEAKFIEGTLTQLLKQSYAPECFEILVVDGQSSDGTQELVRKFADRYPNVHLLDNPRRLSSAARNIGVRHASGDVVLVVDGHCELEDDRLLANVADAFETSGADCVGRPQPLDIRAATPLQRAIAAARSSWLGHHPDSFIYSDQAQFVPAASVAVAYRREVFEKVGCFDEQFDACEDYEFNTRCDKAGLRCYFTPTAAICYQPRATLRGLFKQLFRYGLGRVRLIRKHPETFAVRTLLPALLVAGTVLGLLLGGFSSTIAAAWLIAVGIYVAVIGAVSVQVATRHRDLPLVVWLPVVFPIIHFAAGTGLLIEGLRVWSRTGVRDTDLDTAAAADILTLTKEHKPSTGMGSLRVVVIDEELPYPPNSGKRIRSLNLITRLAKRHDITYICHRNHNENEIQPAIEYLENCGIRPIVVDRSIPQKSGLAFYARLAANLLSRKPYSVQIHNSRQLRKALREQLATGKVDLIQAEWTPYADCLRHVDDIPWVVMAHNIESLIWQRYHESESDFAKRWYINRQWRKFESFEKQVFAVASRVVTVSQPDADLARNQFTASHVDVVDNGVDIDYFHPAEVERNPNRLLFLGSLDWRPNLDAVASLLDQVFPRIAADAPLAQLDIVGRNPPDWLLERAASTANVDVHANVPDVRPFLWQSGLMVVPLRIGGGSRLKILEALATGCPVVSTRVGAEGLNLTPGKHFAEVSDLHDLPQAVLDWITHHKEAQTAAYAGRDRVIKQYSWDKLAERLDRVWRQVGHDS